MDPLSAGLAFAVVAVGALLQGSVGFGLALVAAPLLVLLDPLFVPGPLLLAALVLALLMSYRERREVDLGMLRWAVVGRIAGGSAAAYLLASLPKEPLALLFAGLVLLGVLLSLSGLSVEPTDRSLLGASVLSGFMGTITAIGGPPMAMLYQNSPGPKLRGMLSSFFVAGTIISLSLLTAVGKFGLREARAGLLLVPGILAGFAVSAFVAPHLDKRAVRPLVLFVSAASAFAVIIRTLL